MSDYRYIGKNGMPILARELEDQRDAAIARIAELEKALRFGCGAAINGLNDESGSLPEWSEGSGIAVMLNALGCHERCLNERVRVALTDPKGGAE